MSIGTKAFRLQVLRFDGVAKLHPQTGSPRLSAEIYEGVWIFQSARSTYALSLFYSPSDNPSDRGVCISWQ